MRIKNKILIAEQTLSTIHRWIISADQKVNIFLAFQGVILSLLIPNYLKSITARFQTNTISFWDGLFVFGATTMLALAIINALAAILPRLGNKEQQSLIYFGSINVMSKQQFLTRMRDINEVNYLDELFDQIYINAKIAAEKHRKFWNSIIFFLIGMSLLVGTYVSLKFL